MRLQSYKKMLPDYECFTASSKIICGNAGPTLFQDIELLNTPVLITKVWKVVVPIDNSDVF